MGIPYYSGSKKLKELLERLEKLEQRVDMLSERLKEVRKYFYFDTPNDDYKPKRPIDFLEVPCPACQTYHKVPNFPGRYKLCWDSVRNECWYAIVDEKGNVKLE